jgi:hypothetical protein
MMKPTGMISGLGMIAISPTRVAGDCSGARRQAYSGHVPPHRLRRAPPPSVRRARLPNFRLPLSIWRHSWAPALVVLLTILGIVHAAVPATAQTPAGAPVAALPDRGGEGLPPPVAEMREAILEAVRSGKIEDLRIAVELNEIKPTIGDVATGDPVESLRRLAGERDGHDLLAAIGAVLSMPWAVARQGADHENNRVFVWPRLAETGVAELSAADEAELAQLAPPEALARMRSTGVYDLLRIGIGADGSWHYLRK